MMEMMMMEMIMERTKGEAFAPTTTQWLMQRIIVQLRVWIVSLWAQALLLLLVR
jgi:hypothetical protein